MVYWVYKEAAPAPTVNVAFFQSFDIGESVDVWFDARGVSSSNAPRLPRTGTDCPGTMFSRCRRLTALRVEG